MNVRKWLLHGAAICLVAPALTVGLTAAKKPAGGPTTIKVDGQVIKGYIEYMSSDDKEGRRSMTPGYEKVAEWAASRFKEWGLQPAGDNGTFIQEVRISGRGSGTPWTTGVPSLAVDGRAFYVNDGDFTVDPASTAGVQAEAEVVFIGYGISAPAKGLDEYAGVDVKGKVVLALKGSPKDAPAARGMFGAIVAEPASNEAWTDESRDQAKIKTAYDKGAAAILLFNVDRLSPAAPPAAPAVRGMMPPPAPAAPYARPFIVVSDVSERVFRHVMFRDPQESPRGALARMDQWRRDIRDKKPHSMATGFKAQVKGYQTATFFSEKLGNNISRNVIAKVQGTDPKLASQVIVVGGHLDHVGVTNGVVFNGADDNASGAATVMEMARLMAANAATIKPRRTTYFALWCGEEMGLLGSEYWVKHPTDNVKIENVVVNFNNDMVGLGDRIGAPGGLNFPAIWEVIMKNQDPEVVKNLETSTSGPGGSDHSAFIEQGIEALALMTAGGVGHPDYHDAGDDTHKIDPEMLRKNGQFLLQGIINVATETVVNLLIPDRLHLYNGMRLTPANLAEIRPGGGRARMMAGMPAEPQGPRFNVSLSDVSAFGANPALIDVAAKLLSVGRVDVPSRGDGIWFTASGMTDRGKAALKAFEAAGVVLTFVNPPKALLADVLENARKGFLVSDSTLVPDAALAKKIVERNVLFCVEFDVTSPQAVASRLIALKAALGGSGHLLLTTAETSATSPMGDAAPTPRQQRVDAAKQQMYLALVKAGWTKDEIYAMVGVSPAPAGAPQMPAPGAARLGGNFGKIGQ